MNHCLNARHLSNNSVSALKTLTTAPPKFVQRLITTQAKLGKQRRSSVQDFCVGSGPNSPRTCIERCGLADPRVHELASSDAKLCLGGVGAEVNFAGAENCHFLTAAPCSQRAYGALTARTQRSHGAHTASSRRL